MYNNNPQQYQYNNCYNSNNKKNYYYSKVTASSLSNNSTNYFYSFNPETSTHLPATSLNYDYNNFNYSSSLYSTSPSNNSYSLSSSSSPSSSDYSSYYSSSENSFEANTLAQLQTPVIQPTAKKGHKKPTATVRHQLLPDEAVDLLNEWFNEHIHSPYPTNEEKERLAMKGGITVKQVNAWFSNRRNRSSNTRPKRIRREFEKEITNIVNELDTNRFVVNKERIIEKLQKS